MSNTYSDGNVLRVVDGLMVQLDVGFTTEEIKTLAPPDLERLFQVRLQNAVQAARIEWQKELNDSRG